jgi:hypothetical protein
LALGLLLGAICHVAWALPSVDNQGAAGDLTDRKPLLQPLTPKPATTPVAPPAPVAGELLPAGQYLLTVVVNQRVFEALMSVTRTGNQVVAQAGPGGDVLRGSVDARGQLTLMFEQPGELLTLQGPLVNQTAAGSVRYAAGNRVASARFELAPEVQSASRKAKQQCDAGCQQTIRLLAAELSRLARQIKLR